MELPLKVSPPEFVGWRPVPIPELDSHLLTDSSAVVRLKREFRVLDELEQNLKEQAAHTRQRLEVARVRKSEIAREIFSMGQ